MAYDQQAQHEALIVRFNNPAGLPADLLAQQGVFKSTNDVNTYLVKVDHQWSAATHVTARYNYSRNKALNGTFTGSYQRVRCRTTEPSGIALTRAC